MILRCTMRHFALWLARPRNPRAPINVPNGIGTSNGALRVPGLCDAHDKTFTSSI